MDILSFAGCYGVGEEALLEGLGGGTAVAFTVALDSPSVLQKPPDIRLQEVVMRPHLSSIMTPHHVVQQPEILKTRTVPPVLRKHPKK